MEINDTNGTGIDATVVSDPIPPDTAVKSDSPAQVADDQKTEVVAEAEQTPAQQ